jgi:hypothetical protein
MKIKTLILFSTNKKSHKKNSQPLNQNVCKKIPLLTQNPNSPEQDQKQTNYKTKTQFDSRSEKLP